LLQLTILKVISWKVTLSKISTENWIILENLIMIHKTLFSAAAYRNFNLINYLYIMLELSIMFFHFLLIWNNRYNISSFFAVSVSRFVHAYNSYITFTIQHQFLNQCFESLNFWTRKSFEENILFLEAWTIFSSS
jgi:hypothetical protein